jgi:PAS domain-containing protein
MKAKPVGMTRDEGSDRHAKLFEMLLEAIPSSVLLIDDQLRVVAVNRNFLEKNRKSREGAVGARLHNLATVSK